MGRLFGGLFSWLKLMLGTHAPLRASVQSTLNCVVNDQILDRWRDLARRVRAIQSKRLP